jgi:hypothetical protein
MITNSTNAVTTLSSSSSQPTTCLCTDGSAARGAEPPPRELEVRIRWAECIHRTCGPDVGEEPGYVRYDEVVLTLLIQDAIVVITLGSTFPGLVYSTGVGGPVPSRNR